MTKRISLPPSAIINLTLEISLPEKPYTLTGEISIRSEDTPYDFKQTALAIERTVYECLSHLWPEDLSEFETPISRREKLN